MRRLGWVVSLLLPMLGGVPAWSGTGSHCTEPAAAGHHHAHGSPAQEARAAGTALGAGAECAHCPADECAGSDTCAGSSAPQLAAALPSFVVRADTTPAPTAGPYALRSTSSSPPTPPPQALA
jgi:hypothetical protein